MSPIKDEHLHCHLGLSFGISLCNAVREINELNEKETLLRPESLCEHRVMSPSPVTAKICKKNSVNSLRQ